ncbi:uncharacterized protein [Drosophila tropicalis]|uniref:uncharacterized protein n=1 Tax=Drosophila tropicalis TaxID=46794 RepID=UPI0035ABD86D
MNEAKTQMSEFPLCLTNSTRELARLTEQEKLKADLKEKQRRHTAKLVRKQKPPSAQMVLWQKMWNEHRDRVENAVSKLDAEPPSFQAARITGVNSLRDDAVVFMHRTKENIQLLVEISRTMRTHGAVNPFRYEHVHVTSAVPTIMANLDLLERENRDLGKRILDVRSEVDSGLNPETNNASRLQKGPTAPLILSEDAINKYKVFNLNLPTTDAERKKLFRPRIFFDIYLKDARPLGRIIVQLYTEAAPVVVLQIVRSCMCKQANKFHAKRLFPSLWMDVNLELPFVSPLHNPLEYDAKVMDHGSWNHVLSFSKEYCKTGFQDALCFAISFKPLSVCNGSRVGFGRIIKGSKICDCIQSYGTKNGKLSRGILFTSCGLL